MNRQRFYIYKGVFLLLLWLCVGLSAKAQLTARVGKTTQLSVVEVSTDTYVWELYDLAKNVNFATTLGNCSETKARFVDGKNTGNTVNVEWLAEGEYFYKVSARNACANNIKIGRIIVQKATVPPKPTVSITYLCEDATAILKAENYQGKLLWSTGETTETIRVTKSGTYWLTQTVNGTESEKAIGEVRANIQPGKPHNAKAIPSMIYKGGVSKLSAKGCDNSTLRWYKDKELTEELTDLTVKPEETTTYYVVCENEIGCTSEYTAVTVSVNNYDDAECARIYKNIRINQFLSPNGDGKNDVWILSDVLDYCEKCNKKAVIKLFNRWGAKVYEKNNQQLPEEAFDGYSSNSLDFDNEKLLPNGTYFYIIEIDEENYLDGYIYLLGGQEYKQD